MGFAEDRKEWLDLLRPFAEERGFSRHAMHVAASVLAEHGDDVRSMSERQLLSFPQVGPEVAKFIFSYFHQVKASRTPSRAIAPVPKPLRPDEGKPR